jgi:hypothetical protein
MALTARALVGPLRAVWNPAARTHSFADDTGARRVLFMSNFAFARTWRNDPAEGLRQLEAMASVYQGARCFRVLAADYGSIDPNGPWHGREVDPAWSIDVWREILRAAKARAFRFHLTEGHRWNRPLEDELDFTERFCAMVESEGASETIAVWECWNEYWQNTAYGQSDQQVDIGRQMIAIVRRTLSTVPLCGLGAARDSEAPESFDWASRGGSDVTVIHGTRYMPDAVKRAFGAWYWEGNPGSWSKPIWQGEPTGPGEGVSVARCDDPGYLAALHGMFALTGQGAVAVSGAGIWGRRPVDTDPLFRELPMWLAELPEDIATWTHEPGGRIWWWSGPNNRCATVTVEGWDYTPPRALKSWKVIGPGGTIRDGAGALTLPAGYHGAIVVGEFA